MLSLAVWIKFLFIKVIAITYLFTLTSFSKQSASWKVLEICELCALSTDSRKRYSVKKHMYTGSSGYSFDSGGGNKPRGGGEETEETLDLEVVFCFSGIRNVTIRKFQTALIVLNHHEIQTTFSP